MKLTAENLLRVGFKQQGYWYILGNMSINLVSKTIKHIEKPYFTAQDFNKDIIIEDILSIERILERLY